MSTALIMSRAQIGLTAPAVTVEVHLPPGLPGFSIAGLSAPDTRERVKSAIQNSRYVFPRGRVVVNLGPADLPKSGGRYDLAIAIGILIASGQLRQRLFAEFDVVGELSLFGDVRPVRGCLTAAREASTSQRKLLAPAANGDELMGPPARRARLIDHVDQLYNVLAFKAPASVATGLRAVVATAATTPQKPVDPLADVVGQYRAKRALTIAAAGGHHMLMIGPPGAGKTMLAQRLSRLLPPMTGACEQQVAEIYSVVGLPRPPAAAAPFRAPHHSASAAALTGGGSQPQPGEVTLAHHGILFLDELPEFRRDALEALREPLEEGRIRISRRSGAVTYPARFQLIAAMNPCPAGLACKPSNCRCSPDQAERYRNRISAPILDRIDLHVDVHSVPIEHLLTHGGAAGNTDPAAGGLAAIAAIATARNRQLTRSNRLNAHLSQLQTKRHCAGGPDADALLGQAADRLELSARVFYRTLRVARTIADLAGDATVTTAAVKEALSYRMLTT